MFTRRQSMAGKSLALITVSAFALASCNMKNQDLGTLIGAGGGALAGKAVCGQKSEVWCMVAGAAIGGFLGNQIGKRLDEADKERHAQATAKVLAATSTGNGGAATSNWRNPDNGTSGRVRVVKEEQETQNTKVPVLKDRVETVPPLELIGEVYSTNKNLNVRVGPGTDYRTQPPALSPGTQFNAIGRVIDKPDWLMIADIDNGAGRGYVYAPLVQASGIAVAAKPANASADRQEVSVSTVRQCKTLDHEITYQDGSTEHEEVKMCQRGDGSWDIV